MITAVDTNVLIDVFSADETFGPRSREAIRRALSEGSLVACEVVWAEIAASFARSEEAEAAMSRLGVRFDGIDQRTALDAGSAWHAYRRRGGRRQRVIADFLIGAHARAHTDRLLTRDRGVYRTYFEGLTVLDPSAR